MQAFAEAGYGFATSFARFEPYAGVTYAYQQTYAFHDTGGSAVLSGDDSSLNSVSTTLRLRGEADLFKVGELGVSARGGLGWRHAYGDVDTDTRLHFSGGSDFTVDGLPILRDSAEVEVGLNVSFNGNAALELSYNGSLAEDARDHDVSATFHIRY